MPIVSVNPANGEELAVFAPLTVNELDAKLQRAAEAFRSYRRMPIGERGHRLTVAAEILFDERDKFGRLMTTEMGKTLKAAIAEVEKCAWACRFCAERGEGILADEQIRTEAAASFVRYQPLGPVLAIMPWNFPFWQVFRFAAPALMAGNVGLLKHASNVPQCALAIEEIFNRAGFPAGVFQTLLIGADQVEAVLNDPRVVAASLTGSEAAGSSVGGTAGRVIKKTVLELGGSDPFIVMPGASLETVCETAVQARIINNGQSCIAAKRFIIHEAIYDEFARCFVEGLKRLRVGDPCDDSTDLGPLALPQIVADLEEQVRRSVELGARLLTGGSRAGGPGNFYEPTALADIPRNSPAYREEVFGPVALLFRARDISEAIAIANDTSFGLGASVWTNDPSDQRRFIDEIEAGQVFVNTVVASDPRLPFGGIKHSGFGRELSSVGMREFTNVKTVVIKDTVTASPRANDAE